MNNKRLALALTLVGLVAVFVIVKEISNGRVGVETGNGADRNLDEPIAGESSKQQSRIVSETLTSTGTVYLVTKNGKTNTTFVPDTMRLTPDELKQVLFPSDEQPPVFRARGPGLNPLLVFYGVAVDEGTNGLAGAIVEANVMIDPPETESRREIFSTTAGKDGRFELQIPWGQQMMVTATHTTNYVSPPSQWFQFGPVGDRPIHNPDPNNPVVFAFHRVLPAESLVEIKRWWGAPNNGDPVRIDLTTGERVATGGDLVVSIFCPEPYTNMRQFPWKLNIQVVEGGLLAANVERLEFMHEAPAIGYQNGFQIEFGPSSEAYRRQYDGFFFVSSRAGQIFAKLQFNLRLHWDERGVPFGIHSFANTNGSRNLQTVTPP